MASVTAFVMITTEGRRTSDVAQRVAQIDGVVEVYSVTGVHDLIAILHLSDFERLAEIVPDQIALIDGVTATETTLAFRAYGRGDLDSAFDIGLS